MPLTTAGAAVAAVLHHHPHHPVPVLPPWQVFPGMTGGPSGSYSGGVVLALTLGALVVGLFAGRRWGFQRAARHLGNAVAKGHVRTLRQETSRSG